MKAVFGCRVWLSLITSAMLLIVCNSCGSPSGARPGPRDPDAPSNFSETESGLRYRIVRKSDGKKPDPTSEVTVHYRGWLTDQTVFDSSYRRGEPKTFSLSKLVPGWKEGLLLIGEGGMIELEVPPSLAYGETGAPPTIPENATLYFLVELIAVADPQEP